VGVKKNVSRHSGAARSGEPGIQASKNYCTPNKNPGIAAGVLHSLNIA
jgi:hypothetical protein